VSSAGESNLRAIDQRDSPASPPRPATDLRLWTLLLGPLLGGNLAEVGDIAEKRQFHESGRSTESLLPLAIIVGVLRRHTA
jgi:hypothetical protein